MPVRNSSFRDNVSSSTSSSDNEFSDAHSSDFHYESYDESDTNLRGLNFNSLPVQSSQNRTKPTTNSLPCIKLRT